MIEASRYINPIHEIYLTIEINLLIWQDEKTRRNLLFWIFRVN